MALNPGPGTVTIDRLRKAWREYQPTSGRSYHKEYKRFSLDEKGKLERPRAARRFCLTLFSSVRDPCNHLAELDTAFGPFYQAPFLLRSSQAWRQTSEETILEKTSNLLSRLPATVPDILDALTFDAASLTQYQLEPAEGCVTDPSPTPGGYWTQFRVTHHVNDLVIHFALTSTIVRLTGGPTGLVAGPVLDSCIHLLKLILATAAEETPPDSRWLIVCIYIWTCWQRCLMIYLWQHMIGQLDGYDYETNYNLHLMGPECLPKIHTILEKQYWQQLHDTQYLCGWSYRSLRYDRASISMDLRYLSSLHHNNFGDRFPICNPGPSQCDGSSSQNCRRFKDTEVQNQSMHDFRCDKHCPRLFWSRESFVNVSGAPAVDIASTSDNVLQYRKATEKTMAISHVWSHGQGGRPEQVGPEGTGFNLCLHRRYADLAASLGCDSYWMDTACIPVEKDLRQDCIRRIDNIFAESEKTLICDRDIMTIDVSKHTVEAYESVLATLLVCDWGLRAWTMLESVRARKNLYLLCRCNQVVRLETICKAVHARGRIDLIILLLGRDNLFPQRDAIALELFDEVEPPDDHERAIGDGYLSIGEASALLSHQHASRDGDDLLIWSLLIGEKRHQDPLDMWKQQVGKSIKTGLLLSSAQRIHGHPGWGWAPHLPNQLQHVKFSGKTSKVYPAYDGSETSQALITAEGLQGRWLICHLPTPSASSESSNTPHSRTDSLFAEITASYLQDFPHCVSGALLQAMPRIGPRVIPSRYRGAQGHLMVVVCKQQLETGGFGWEWRGIYEWNAAVPLPDFKIEDLLLV